MQAGLSPPPGWSEMSLSEYPDAAAAELSCVRTAPGPQTCRWYSILYGCHICLIHILDFFHSSEEETLIHPMQSTHSLCLELSNRDLSARGPLFFHICFLSLSIWLASWLVWLPSLNGYAKSLFFIPGDEEPCFLVVYIFKITQVIIYSN